MLEKLDEFILVASWLMFLKEIFKIIICFKKRQKYERSIECGILFFLSIAYILTELIF